MNTRSLCYVLLTLLPIVLAAGCAPPRGDVVQSRLKVASTTSLCDSGLWDHLEPLFEGAHGVDLQVLCAGTGVAIRYGEEGDVDAIVVHDPEREEQFISQGYGSLRMPFACNQFLIVGPGDDPGGIRGLKPEDAFARLAMQGNAVFVSRGDGSGTHAREKEIWRRAGLDYEQVRKSRWYIESGAGMGSTLQLASDKRGYTLTDRATFLTYARKLDLVPLVEGGEAMSNFYSIIVVNPGRHRGINYQAARLLADFLVSQEVQDLLRDFGVQVYGEPLFLPYGGCQQGPGQRLVKDVPGG